MIDIAAALVLAEQIVGALVKIAPAVEQGVVSTQPYVSALAGMLTGGNATQDQVDALLSQLESDSADFQLPLPPAGTAAT